MAENAVEMRGITKRFGSLVANQGIDLTLQERRIHALLGENGAGKSTLSKILYGLYQPDEGEIRVHGSPVRFNSPADAIAAGVGMVTQHFSLVPNFTVAENIILGIDRGLRLDRRQANDRISEIAARYGLKIDPSAVVRGLALGEQQRVEILKALYRNCRVLILDEPTAVLTPRESDALFGELKTLVAQGLSIMFISHKLHEIVDHCDAVTVLRDGRVIASQPVHGVTTAQLASQMVGRDMLLPERTSSTPGDPVLRVNSLSLTDRQGVSLLTDVTFEIRQGEIVGLAGVAGNGQRELSELLSGLQRATGGGFEVNGHALTDAGIEAIKRAGVGRIPEDRLQGIVGNLSVALNLALEYLDDYTHHGRLDQRAIQQNAETLIKAYQIKAQPEDNARRLSGGNIQKIILARTLSRNPALIIAAQPTRGLDIGATEYVHERLRQAAARGAAVLLISEDLDEVFKLADRIAVMHAGRLMGILPTAEATVERLGLLMGGVSEEAQHG